MRTVIITGAAGGIGSETAGLFAEQGYRLVLCDQREAELQQLKTALQERFRADCLLCPGNLAEEAYWQQVVEQAMQRYGRIDVLVNNAAWRTIETLRTMELATWEQTLRICLTAPAFLSRLTAAKMQPGSVIVNVSSMMADRPAGTSPAYIAAKGAIDALTRELAVTYGRQGIRVVGVSPGFIDTDLSRDYTNASQLISEIVDRIPLARGGTPREVAAAICWLSAEQAAYVTGTTLVVDGGFKPNFSPYSIKRTQFPEEF
jgi:NAD(P)-dependent dehydrogenase (short-subunit alcohol dehydrogenase family)